jgi:threonylcarbamoyladenosine tRNA methylthiotransferase MtaB
VSRDLVPGRLSLVTLGCKVNQYEGACIGEPFLDAGWEIVDDEADVYVINTCTVTGRTDFKSRNAVRKALAHKARDPGVRIYVTGCYAQRFPDEILALGDIDAVIGNQNKARIFDFYRNEAIDSPGGDVFAEMSAHDLPDRARAFVKVQDGCDCFCAYCAVPFARGVPRSRSVESTLRQVRILVDAGFSEIVLAGVNLGLWGREWGRSLADLVDALTRVDGLEILRLSSLEPQFVDDALIDRIAASRLVAPHFHLPLQSGSDELLAKMGRRYGTDRFREVVNRLLAARPDTALGYDVIVGLPGETDARFAETIAFLESITFAYLHVFAYSVRPGTRAASMEAPPTGDVAAERSRSLRKLAESRKRDYARRLVETGVTLRGVVESISHSRSTALSDHYLRIYGRDSETGILRGKALRPFHDGLEVSP